MKGSQFSHIIVKHEMTDNEYQQRAKFLEKKGK